MHSGLGLIVETAVNGQEAVNMLANAFAEDRQKALESGMDGHIAKPIDQHELTETLAKFCERAR